ncbi:hypothetical protein [Streptomyces collinus]|uniref:hypothetical protein n=1 Tax=Streptomyces collinus TaxID=42684 RepID=UPI0037CF928E
MDYDLLLVGPPVPPASLTEALTEAVRTEGVDVDVADRDSDRSATASGRSVRARLYSTDEEPPVHTIDAVGSAVSHLPQVRVSDLP